MINFENTETWGFEHALRGMRNPLNSWHKSDSRYEDGKYVIGENDLNLAQRLCKAGSEHRKFMRQIFVSVDITAPLYWWKEMDTYKVGTVANSCSTMHKIQSKPIELSDFSIDDFKLDEEGIDLKDMFINVVADCEVLRKTYVETKDKRYWKGLIELLPTSYNQKRTVTMNYENIYAMYRQRKNHKLDEWSEGFISWVESLPYAKELIIGEDK